MIERALRWAAVAIALAALVDPALTVSGRARVRVAVASLYHGSALREQADRIRDRLHQDLAPDFHIVDGLDRTAAATIVVSDRYPDDVLPEGAPVSTVTLGTAEQPGVRVIAIDAPRTVPPATAIRLTIAVRGSGVRGSTSRLSVRAGGAEVGRATHQWSGDAETWSAALDVIPSAAFPAVLTVDVDGARSPRAPVIVDAAPRMRVRVLEARPSWAAAFVRRALESDPRFEVSATSAAAPKALITTGTTGATIDFTTEDVVVAGGLDRLTPADRAALDRFARERGGAVLLLPDERIPAAVNQEFFPGVTFHEALLEKPAALEAAGAPRIDASELLEAEPAPDSVDIDVVARSAASKRPLVWSVRRGQGRVAVSGAMDAWRFRGDQNVAFDRFWRSVVSGLALSAMPPIAITLRPDRAVPGERVRVTARVRALERDQLGDRLAVDALAGDTPLRLWPDAEPGTFSGSFVVPTASRPAEASRNAEAPRSIEVVARGFSRASGATVARGFARATIHDLRAAPNPPLALLAHARGGVDVDESSLGRLEDHLKHSIAATTERATRHPLRSAWWFAPFAACLCGEWWLRRRRGER